MHLWSETCWFKTRDAVAYHHSSSTRPDPCIANVHSLFGRFSFQFYFYRCICDQSHVGLRCETQLPTTTVPQPDPCIAVPPYCFNGGLCRSLAKPPGYTCDCNNANYHGQNCEIGKFKCGCGIIYSIPYSSNYVQWCQRVYNERT